VLAGVVTDGVAHTPIDGVAVTVKDSGGATLASGATDSSGHFSLTVPGGAVQVSFAKDYYTSPAALLVGVVIGQTVTIGVTMNEAASAKPSVALAAPGNDVGYGAQVALTATASSPLGRTLTYSWANATVPVLGSVTGTDAAGSVTMPTLAQAFAYRVDPTNPNGFIAGYTLENRIGIVPIVYETRGQVSASVTVNDGHGQSATASIAINAASVRGNVRNVAIGTRVYVNSGHDATNAWSITAPTGSTATFDDATLRTPSFVADIAGTYTLTEGGNALTITAGDWMGMITGGSGNSVTVDTTCQLCHNNGPASLAIDEFTPWLGTGHATQMTRGINGVLSPYYSMSCIECHSVGFDTGVNNHGFDDVARAAGWTMSSMNAGNWDAMIANEPAVARMANIQCENCHGPQASTAHQATDDVATRAHRPFISPRVSYGAENCGVCHGAGAHHIYSEWATMSGPELSGELMAHSSRAGATHAISATGLNSSCGRCHSAQGYNLYVGALETGKVGLDTANAALAVQMGDVTAANVEPVTCVACHDPHDASNPNQLRLYGDTPLLPGGFAGYGLGKGALCVSCHNSRNGAKAGAAGITQTYLHEDGEAYNAGNPTGYSAPHQACQGDVFTGHNAYFMSGSLPMTSRHAAIEDTCVGCHMTLNPNKFVAHGAPATNDHVFRIVSADKATLCANCHGANVDGEGIQGAVEAGMSSLASRMGTAVKTKMNGFAGGIVRVRAWDTATDLYSSTSANNIALDVVGNPVTAVGIEEIHGQIGFAITLTAPISIQFVDGAGNPVGAPKSTQTFGVQMGAVKDNQATPVALYALTGNFVRAGWNYFLIEGDQSKGLHNPTFVQAVLDNTLRQDLSY
jgi:hypothetical protein